MQELRIPSPLEKITELTFLNYYFPNFYIKRDDLIHPIISGNKWRKLEGFIQHFFDNQYKKIITFGGAFSNHMLATAQACNMYKIPCACFIRGNELNVNSNYYLQHAANCGMELIPIERNIYANEKEKLIANYCEKNPNTLVIGEGGKGEFALVGLQHLIDELPFEPDVILHASATGTTAVGLAMAVVQKKWNTKIYSIAVLKNSLEQQQFFIEKKVEHKIEIIADFTFGGYAKKSEILTQFCGAFIQKTNIRIEPIYTGKSLFALQALFKKNCDKKIVFLHTGGVF